jgi:hypothetical protein
MTTEHSRPSKDRQIERATFERRREPCDDLRDRYVRALGVYLTTWREEPVEGRTDQELHAMLDWFHTGDEWGDCLKQQTPIAKERTRMTALFAKRDTLERRLDDGYAKIDAGIAAGKDASSWEDFWIELLREYEDVEKEIAAVVVSRDTVVIESENDDRDDDNELG